MKTGNPNHWQSSPRCFSLISALSLILVAGCPVEPGLLGGLEPGDTRPLPDATDQTGSGASEPTKYELRVAIRGLGGIDPTGGEYAAGERVTLTATPAKGWLFDRWEGDVTGDANPVIVTMDADKVVIAVFVEDDSVGGGGLARIMFRATYHRLLDTDMLLEMQGCSLSDPALMVMNRDGRRVAFLGRDDNGRHLFITNWAATEMSRYSLSMFRDGGLHATTISRDGSTFYAAGYRLSDVDNPTRIIKVDTDHGTLTRIRDDMIDGVHHGPTRWYMQATSDGKYLFFNDARNVYRIRHDGTDFQAVVVDSEVPSFEDIVPTGINYFAASDDGHTIAFEINGYWWDEQHGAAYPELFVQVGGRGLGKYRHLPADGPSWRKHKLAISPDGSAVAFAGDGPSGEGWYRIRTDATGLTFISDQDVVDCVVQFADDGETLYNNAWISYAPGVLFDPFPRAIGHADWTPSVSADGAQIAFMSPDQQQGKYILYMGYLVDEVDVAGTPKIERIFLDHQRLPRGAPDPPAVLSAKISDPDGLQDITSVRAWELVDGQAQQVGYFACELLDDGEGADVTAGDGVFTCRSGSGHSVGELAEFTVRIEVKDTSGNFAVADTVVDVAP